MRAVVLRYPRDLPHKRHQLRLSALVGRQGPKPSRSLSIIQQHALGPSGFGLASSLPCSTTMPVRGRYEAPPSAAPGGCGRPFCCSTSSARSGSASDAHTCTRAHAHTHFVRWPGTLALPLCSASRLSRTAPPRWTRRTPPTLPAKPACFARCPPCCPPGQAQCPYLRTGARSNLRAVLRGACRAPAIWRSSLTQLLTLVKLSTSVMSKTSSAAAERHALRADTRVARHSRAAGAHRLRRGSIWAPARGSAPGPQCPRWPGSAWRPPR